MKRILFSLFAIMTLGNMNAQLRQIVIDGKNYMTAVVDSAVCRNPDTGNVYGGEHNSELQKFMMKNLRYPALAQENKVEGRVMVLYIVNEEGVVSSVTPVHFNGHKATETKSIAEVALEAEMQKRNMSEKQQRKYLQGVRELLAEAVRVTFAFPKSLQPAMKDGKPVKVEMGMPYTFRLKK